MVIGARLREERNRLGLTQPELAARAGVGKQAQLRYEAGERNPDTVYLAALADAGADVLYIVTGQRSQALPPEATLPQDERALLDAYRACSPEARRNLIATAALLSAGMAPAAPAPPPTALRMKMGNINQVSRGAGAVQVGQSSGPVFVHEPEHTYEVKKPAKRAKRGSK